jgi:putative transposase
VSSFVGYLKGKSSLMIFDRHANLKYRYGIGNFGVEDFMWIQLGRNKKGNRRIYTKSNTR